MNQRGNSYSLSFLFLLLTLCGILAGHVSAVLPQIGESELAKNYAVPIIFAVMIGTVLIGLIVGVHHNRRRRGLAIGGLAGLAAGLVIVPLCFASPAGAGRVIIVQLGGSTMLIVIASLLRVLERGRSNASDNPSYGEMAQTKEDSAAGSGIAK